MADQNCSPDMCFKDAVCIDTGRVYDSCCDRDCLEDLRVLFSTSGQEQINQACNIRARSAEILDVVIDVEPVTFNRGFYAIDMIFYFKLTFDVYSAPTALPDTVVGLASFEKKVILFGSEGNAKIFSSDYLPNESDDQLPMKANLPKAYVQVVDPVILSTRSCMSCPPSCACTYHVPKGIATAVGGELDTGCASGCRVVLVTLGLFTVVQLTRNVQMLIPVYDFCMPEKECTSTTDNPCELFKRIKFPTDEFFPPRVLDCEDTPEDGCCQPCQPCD